MKGMHKSAVGVWAAKIAILSSLAIASAQPIGFNPAMDQMPTPVAAQMFQTAVQAECGVLEQYNPGITYCGMDYLRRNPTLQSWGLTSPGPGLQSVTRYNPVSLTAVLNKYGAVAAFFVFAHEGGHHFDIEFHQPVVPWTVPVYPSAAYPAQMGVPPYVAFSWNRELRADAWGGCAVKRTGNQIVSVQVLQYITVNMESADVPPFNYAQQAIQAGYNAC